MDEKIIQLNSSQINAIKSFQEGEMVFNTDTEEYQIWSNNTWHIVPKEAKMAGQGLEVNLYELNKQIISQTPVLEDLTKAEETIEEFRKHINTNYHMLLCKDISYYTVFTHTDDTMVHFATFGEAVLECAMAIGEITSVEFANDKKEAVEIWVRSKEHGELCMYLFNAEPMIVTYAN